jgi:hypothetical protein
VLLDFPDQEYHYQLQRLENWHYFLPQNRQVRQDQQILLRHHRHQLLQLDQDQILKDFRLMLLHNERDLQFLVQRRQIQQ